MSLSTPTPNRTTPRLWVEKLWLLKSLDAEEPLREIALRRGLNLVVSPPQDGSTGHGVGKTAFCQLLRFVLDDPLWATGSALRDELRYSLPDGAVAACVHIGDETWTVVKPWQHQKQYRASREATWQQLARSEAQNDYSAYGAALQSQLVDGLPVHELPGSNQAIQWHQILAWCSRDQNARYRSYHQWREDGVGFSLPAQSPALLVKVVLGLLRDASTLKALEDVDKKLKQADAELESYRREPVHLLAHVRRQLTQLLGTDERTPFRQEGVLQHANLLGLSKQRLTALENDQARIRDERFQMDKERQAVIEQRAPLVGDITFLTNHIAQLEAGIAGDWKEVERLQNEASSLQQRLNTFCNDGHLLLKDCDYVGKRIAVVQLDRRQGEAKHLKSQGESQAELNLYRPRLEALQKKCAPLDQRLTEFVEQSRELAERQIENVRQVQRLQQGIEEFEVYERAVAGTEPWGKVAETEARLTKLREDHSRLEAKRITEEAASRERRKVIDCQVHTIAESLPGFTWGVFNDDEKHRARPFRLGPPHSTTFGVLETLAGDVTCLLDSVNADSFHPGFLLHDSPREAEMSEKLFWALTATARGDQHGPFQYVVTTSTSVPAELEPFVRLELHSRSPEGLFFRERIGPETAPLAI